MLVVAIIIAEVLFWVLLFGGLAVRYIAGMKSVGMVMLALTPAIDLILLALTYADLSGGGHSKFVHGLSAFYIGYSLALGPVAIKAMDQRAVKRFGGHQPEPRAESTYAEQLSLWKRALVGSAVTIVLLAIGVAIVGAQGSFWLLYWTITAVFVPISWWFIGPYRELKKTR
ncbi:hypothetical protein [Corynebacterium tapiri]|uniref:Membrane protein YmcC n=1 Tax=Corynebacterium tapiri TaxID=1448266 RepID=A0A5C4U469_9CORY|nr:hypothetical protein [Corynebacterium tapiri]TNL98386.1 hypothetical protein FHE74_04050 [Corynebacterium tapiri]